VPEKVLRLAWTERDRHQHAVLHFRGGVWLVEQSGTGAGGVGYMNGFNWAQWAWVDQPLKKTMGH